MITVITGAAVAFFQSTRIERFVSRNYADLARARLAAEGATAAGQALITSLFTNYPDSAVGWARLIDTELATFYFRTTNANGFLTNGANAATPASQPVFLFAYPLASGANAAALNSFTTSFVVFTNTNTPGGQAGLTTNNRVDLNADNRIGTPPGGTKPALRAKWVELLQEPSQPKNTNLNSAGFPINPAIARYAFWAEDESFRVNLNRSGANPRGNNTPGTNPAEIALQGALSGNNATLAQGITNLQASLRSNLPTPATMALAAPTNNYDANRFVVSVHSSALNLSRGGTLRLNLNQVVTNSTDAGIIRSQLNRILAGITNANTNAAPSNTAAMPNFGQRFYRTDESPAGLNQTNVSGSSSGNAYTNLYLQRVAANIRDYIDTDSIPTVVENAANFPVRPLTSTNPWNAVQGNGPIENEVAAAGKEPTPLLTEYATVLRYIAQPGNNFTFNLAFYFEFWNPTTNTISLADLGNPTLTIGNLYDFEVVGGGSMDPTASVGGQSRPRPVTRIDLPLSGFTGLTNFLPNSFTVLTTDTQAWPLTYSAPARLYTNPSGYLTYSGTRTSTNNRVRAVFGSPRAGTTSTDYDVWMWLAGSQGTIESFSGLVTAVGGGTHALQFTNSSTNIIRVSSLVGNSTASITARTGEPRSINEPIQLSKYLGGGGLNRYSFANASAINTDSSLGFFTNTSGFMRPNNWPDYVPDQPRSPADPPAISPYRHLNGNLDSIGRLGDVYDPARRAVDGTPVQRAIGGGRTFKIGQAERRDTTLNPAGLWDGSESSASRNWTSWRLADVFSVTNSVNLPGVININGALRDNGAALQALAFGLIYESSPGGAQATSGQNLNVANFVTAVRDHLAGGTVDPNPSNDRLFWERGQLSELANAANAPLFSSGSTLAGAPLNTTQDRGREELVRRMVELITTKGNVFTVYAIGQSLNPRTGQPVATQKIKRTFRIDPVFNPALPADNTFDPAQAGTGSATDRFRRPSGFTVSILHNSSE